MSKYFNLVSNEDNKLIPNVEAMTYLKAVKEKIIIIGLISTTDDSQPYSDAIKISLLSNFINSKEIIPNPKYQSLFLYLTNLEKENTDSKIFILDINVLNNKHLFSLCFFICSVFIFCFNENIDTEELKNFKIINSLISTIKLKNKTDPEKNFFFGECAPLLVCYLPQNKSSFNNYYFLNLKEELEKKDANKNINLLKENIIKLFPNKILLYLENNEQNTKLIDKIIEKANPKEIHGKILDGNALAFFFQNFCEMHNNKTNPDFNLLFGNLIYNDLQTFKKKSLNYFEKNVNSLENENEEILIPKIYDIKIKAIEIFNNVQSLNYKIFNKFEYDEYKTSFNTIKNELEQKFIEIENKKLIDNLKNGELICNELLKKHYEIINKKIINGEYNKNNTDEYLNDYKIFLSSYEKEAKGNNKIKCLINFLEINKPKYFKSLLFNENKKKENKNFDEDEEDIEEIKIKLNRKKRDIEHLKEDIARVEDDIKKIQTFGNKFSSKQFPNL